MLFVVLSLFAGIQRPRTMSRILLVPNSGLTRTHTVPRAMPMPIDGISFDSTEWTASVHTSHMSKAVM